MKYYCSRGYGVPAFGPKLMSIVSVNRVFAKAAAEARVIGKAVAGSAGVGCTCAGSRAGSASSSTQSSAAEVGLRDKGIQEDILRATTTMPVGMQQQIVYTKRIASCGDPQQQVICIAGDVGLQSD
jgi:hypothetical protein